VANTKISALPAASALAGVEILPAVQSGADVGVSSSQLAAFASGLPGWVGSNWYMPYGVWSLAVGGALAANSIRLVPFVVPSPMSVKGLGARITTAGSSNIQLALYANNGSTGRPTGSALASTGSLANTVAAQVSAAVGPVLLSPGVYWMAVNSGDATVIMLAPNLNNPLASALAGSATLANINTSSNNTALFLSTPQTFGTWPSLTGASFTENTPSGASGNGCAAVFLQSS
jgi:hypothetical protein